MDILYPPKKYFIFPTHFYEIRLHQIRQFSRRYNFQIQMPSGNRVLVNVNSWGFGISVNLVGNMRGRTEGLCGSFDGISANDLTIKGTTNYFPLSNGGLAPDSVVDSWRSVNLLDKLYLNWKLVSLSAITAI